jgi:hypothetical protein
MGAFSVAALLGAAFLSLALLVLDRTISCEPGQCVFLLSVAGPESGNCGAAAKDALKNRNVRYETRGIQRDGMMRELQNAELHSVSWDIPKKKRK